MRIADVTPDDAAYRMAVSVVPDAPWPYVELQRTDDGGRTWLNVRGESTTDWTVTYCPAARTLYDNEAPLDVPVRYRARGWNAAKTDVTAWTPTTRGFTIVTTSGRWVLAPVTDATNRVVTLTRSARTDKRPISQGIFYALGRADPVVTSDVRRARTGSFTFLANDADERDDFTVLTEAVDVVCARAPGNHWWGMRYVVLGDAQWQRVVDRPDDAWDVIMDWTEVANPPLPMVPVGATYADVADHLDTYGDLPPKFATYAELAKWVP